MSQGAKGASKLMIIAWLAAMVFIAVMFFGGSSDDSVEVVTDSATLERIQPVGEVSVESAVASTGGTERSGEELYARCQGCHGTGAMPPKGGCSDCSDNELKSVIQYMMDREGK